MFMCLCPSLVPDAPDVWVWMNRDNTGQVIWKVIFSRSIFVSYKIIKKKTFINPPPKQKKNKNG